MKIFFSAGEVSGDIFAAGLIKELYNQWKHGKDELSIYGIGSTHMDKAGMQVLRDITDTSSIGILEVLRHLPKSISGLALAKKVLREDRPDVFIPVDCQGFNLPLTKLARQLGIPVIYFIPPQNFVWQDTRRGKQIVQRIDKMINIYKSGYDFYKALGADCFFAGHPVLDLYANAHPEAKFKKMYQLTAKKDYVGIIPGTRHQELKNLFPLFIETANRLYAEDDNLFFLIPAANLAHKRKLLKGLSKQPFPYRIVENDIYSMASICSFVLTKSGTATLDVAAAGCPSAIAYKINGFSYWIMAKLWGLERKLTHVGLPNILAEKEIVPEFLQDRATVENLYTAAAQALYDRSTKNRIKEHFKNFHKKLGQPGVFKRSAKEILTFLSRSGRAKS